MSIVTRSRSTRSCQSSTPQQQASVTDFFSAVVASHSRSNRKNGQQSRKLLFSPTTTTTTLSDDTVLDDKKKAAAKNYAFAEAVQSPVKPFASSVPVEQITPSKRNRPNRVDDKDAIDKKSTESVSASKRATKSTTKKKVTRKASTKSTRSTKMIDFGPRVGKLDFESTTTLDKSVTTTRISRSSSLMPSPKKSSPQKVHVSSPMKVSAILKANDIKEKLKGCKNLAKLKEHLAAINGCADKLKQFKSLKVASPAVNSSPIRSSPRKHVVAASSTKKDAASERLRCSRNLFGEDAEADTNNNSSKLPSDAVPMYYKRSYLTKKTTDVGDELELQLPRHLCDLLLMFKLFDEVTSIHLKRQQTCTFEKVKLAIEESTRRSFSLVSLAKILTVLGPTRKWFKLAYDVVDRRSQLTIAPFYPDHMRCINSSAILMERQREYHGCLLEHTKQAHLKFLTEKQLSLSPSKALLRWHPAFPLDSVPDIKPDIAVLPQPRQKKAKFDDVNANSPNSILNYLIRREPCTEGETSSVSSEAPTLKRVETGKLKGVKMDLLKKIREKEAANQTRLQMRPPTIDRELTTLSVMPQVIRIINQSFQQTNSASQTLDQVIRQLAASSKCSEQLATKRLNDLLQFDEKLSTAHESLLSSNGRTHQQWILKIQSGDEVYLRIVPDYKVVMGLQEAVVHRIKQLNESLLNK